MRSIVSVMVLLVAYSLHANSVWAQKLVISADKMNIAYMGIENPLTIVAEKYPCDKLEVFCNDGTLTNLGDCKYIFRPKRIGICSIVLKARTSSGLKMVGTVTYRVKTIEPPTPKISGKSSGTIGVDVFKHQIGIVADFDNIELNAKAIVTKFKITFIRNGEVLFSADNLGPAFNVEVKRYMEMLHPGDLVSVTDITCIVEAGCPRHFRDISLTLN